MTDLLPDPPPPGDPLDPNNPPPPPPTRKGQPNEKDNSQDRDADESKGATSGTKTADSEANE